MSIVKSGSDDMNLQDGDLAERLIQMGKHGEYKHHAKKLSEICILDNHYKEPNSDVILSSRMIMEEFGGPQAIVSSLFTNPKTGIDGTAVDMKDRQNFYGANSFPPPKIKTICELIMENFEDPINRILCAAAVVSLIIGIVQHGMPDGLLEGTSILVALCIIIVVSSGNNYLSERRLAELVKLSDLQDVAVFRGSEDAITIDASELLVGDLIQF